jgi:flagellar hook-length control protein FliK
MPAAPVPATAVAAPPPPAAIGVDMIETATFMYSRGLPATVESAGASYEYLYASPRLPQVLGSFEDAAAAYLSDAPAGGSASSAASQGLRVAVERLVSLARRMQVSPDGQGVHEQLKDAVEHLGLDHEAKLARAADQADTNARSAATDRRTAATGLQREMAESVRDTLKSAALEVAQRARAMEPVLPAGSARAHISTLREAAAEIVQVVSAQQVGSSGGRDNMNIVQVQIPIAIGGEMRGGDIRVSWQKEKDGKKRDPRVPARMTMEVETRSLGPVGVHMHLLGQALSLIFRVYEDGVRDFINDEMPELVSKLTGYKFRLDQCVCETDEPEPVPAQDAPRPLRAVPPTSSLDLKA